jgi:hypothetical protein
MGRITPHTLAFIITRIADSGHWEGRRRGVEIRLRRLDQLNLEGQRIFWKAWEQGNYYATRPNGLGDVSHRSNTFHKGTAGTVREALDQIDLAMRGEQ